MTTDNDRDYYGWRQEDYPDRHETEEVLVSQMLDHGSINFGRFAVEPLSWEKRSVFVFNKCQEELEKFKAPGLVAQKKAYFEEYYRKVRVQKALQESQQVEITSGYSGDDDCVSSENLADEEDGRTSHKGGKMILDNDLLEENTTQMPVEREIKFDDNYQTRVSNYDTSNHHSSRASDYEGKSSYSKNASESHYPESGIQERRLSVISTEIVEQNESLLVDARSMLKAEESISDTAYLNVSKGYANATITGELKLTSGQKVVKSRSKQAVRESKAAQLSHPKKPYAVVKNDSKLERRTPSVTERRDLKSENKTSMGLSYSLGVKTSQKQSNKVENRSNLSKQIPNACSAVRKDSKVEHKINPNSTNLSQRAKAYQNSSRKAESSNNSCKEISNGSTCKKQSALKFSNKIVESSSISTVLRPFSFATEKRAAISSGIRDTTKMDSRMSRRPRLETVPAKNAAQVNSSKAPVTSTAKGRGPESRVHEVVKKGISARKNDLNYTVGSAARAIHTVGEQKLRSLNLPSQSKSISNFEHGKHTTRNALVHKGKEGHGISWNGNVK